METTRQTIVNILRRRPASVDALTKQLGLAPATIRRHLDILARDGQVDVSQVRRKTGRPHYLFSLTEAGEDLFPKHYARTTNRLIEEIVALGPDETNGRTGSELADFVFKRMATRLAQHVRPHVHGERLSDRVASALEALSEEGVTFEAEAGGGGFRLFGGACPCPRASVGGSRVCAHDQELLSLLLGSDVQVAPANDNGLGSYEVRGGKRPS